MDRSPANETARLYDEVYKQDNYFGCREWLYRPYVKALISLSGLKKGATVLDAGCGQGIFTDLFAKEGMSVFGVDISQVGIQKAKEKYPHLSDHFFVFDLLRPSDIGKVDCVFIRCFSLYDVKDFIGTEPLTRNLFDLLRPEGLIIFAYNSNLSRTGTTWFNHSLSDIKNHFNLFLSGFEIYFINKLDTFSLGYLSFNKLFTFINQVASGITGFSGDIIVIARKDHCIEAVTGRK